MLVDCGGRISPARLGANLALFMSSQEAISREKCIE